MARAGGEITKTETFKIAATFEVSPLKSPHTIVDGEPSGELEVTGEFRRKTAESVKETTEEAARIARKAADERAAKKKEKRKAAATETQILAGEDINNTDDEKKKETSIGPVFGNFALSAVGFLTARSDLEEMSFIRNRWLEVYDPDGAEEKAAEPNKDVAALNTAPETAPETAPNAPPKPIG